MFPAALIILLAAFFAGLAVLCMDRLRKLHLSGAPGYDREFRIVQNRLRTAFSLLIAAGCMMPFHLFCFMGFSGSVFMPMLIAPMAFGMVQEVWQVDGPIYNDVFKRSWIFSIAYLFLLAAGVLAG